MYIYNNFKKCIYLFQEFLLKYHLKSSFTCYSNPYITSFELVLCQVAYTDFKFGEKRTRFEREKVATLSVINKL